MYGTSLVFNSISICLRIPMETRSLDAIIVAFVEENVVRIAIAFIVITIAQLYWLATREPKALLTKEGFHALKLIRKDDVNYNTLFLRFALPEKRQKLGLPIGQHLVFKLQLPEAELPVFRPYTPVSDASTIGHVDFVIKVYPQGVMTQHLGKLKVGQKIRMKGPKGKFKYKPNMKRSIGMLAGGTGITPMYQLLNHILNDPKDKTRVSLIFANVTPADILLKPNLDAFATKHPTQFDVFYVIEKSVPEDWKYGVGYITKDMILEHCPGPKEDSMLLWCGPPPMVEAMKELAEQIGYPEDSTFKF